MPASSPAGIAAKIELAMAFAPGDELEDYHFHLLRAAKADAERLAGGEV
jgi:hypothetical protein